MANLRKAWIDLGGVSHLGGWFYQSQMRILPGGWMIWFGMRTDSCASCLPYSGATVRTPGHHLKSSVRNKLVPKSLSWYMMTRPRYTTVIPCDQQAYTGSGQLKPLWNKGQAPFGAYTWVIGDGLPSITVLHGREVQGKPMSCWDTHTGNYKGTHGSGFACSTFNPWNRVPNLS